MSKTNIAIILKFQINAFFNNVPVLVYKLSTFFECRKQKEECRKLSTFFEKT